MIRALGSVDHNVEDLEVNATLTDEDRKQRLDDLTGLIDMIRPAVQQDGGDLLLVEADVEKGTVEVMLQGSCSSCAISTTTMQAGVERILSDRLPWVTEVRGGVDDSMDPEESAAMGRGAYVPKYDY
jgi:Fe-S cluster biogenesis protein NfuA